MDLLTGFTDFFTPSFPENSSSCYPIRTASSIPPRFDPAKLHPSIMGSTLFWIHPNSDLWPNCRGAPSRAPIQCRSRI